MADSKAKRRKVDMSEMSVDEFMENDFASEDSEDSEIEETIQRDPRGSHSRGLANLQDMDKEFYEFLKENDPQLLNFDLSDEDLSDDAGDASINEVPEKVPRTITSYPKPSGGVEPEEDEKEEEPMEELTTEVESHSEPSGVLVTMAMVKGWLKTVKNNNSMSGMRGIILSLHGGVLKVISQEKDDEEDPEYIVKDKEVFNELLVAGLKNMATFLESHLQVKVGVATQKRKITTHKKWPKLKTLVKLYIQDLMTLLKGLSEASMLAAILKQVQSLISFFEVFPKLQRQLFKQLVVCWSEGEEHVRVLSFLSIRALVLHQNLPLSRSLKTLYLAFVRNSKFTSSKSLPLIKFMQNSLVEMCRMNPATTYQHGFLYIRQLAMLLRNAMSAKNKDSINSLANWQFVHCVRLWCNVLSEVQNASLKPLVYPLTQVALGALQLLSSPRYFPLHLHLIAALHKLSSSLSVFVPTVPHLLRIMQWKGKKPKGQDTMGKPPDLAYLCKLSSGSLASKAIQTSLMDGSYELLMDYFAIHSSSIAFPELIIPTIVQLRKLSKETKFTWFRRQLKQLIEKAEEVADDVKQARSTVNFSPKDTKEIEIWESKRRSTVTPLDKYLSSWRLIKQKETNDKQPHNTPSTSKQPHNTPSTSTSTKTHKNV